MKKTTLIAGLLTLVGAGSAGCKTTPKVAWWKTDKTAETTAVAHTAPALPSDLAKQGAPGQSVIAPTSGEAAPFVTGQVSRASSTTTPSAAYPSTDAPPFTADVASRITSPPATGANAALTSSASSLGSIAASPYNPSAAPRPTIPTSTALPARLPESRYASSTAPAFGSAGISAAGAASTGGAIGSPSTGSSIPGLPNFDAVPSRYASTQPTQAAPVAGTQATDPASYANRYNAAVADTVNAGASMYGQVSGAAANVAGAATGGMQTATAAVAATGQPYRPGGTSSYPSTQAEFEVASRPTGATVGSIGSSPSAAVPGGAATPSVGEAPRYR